MHFFQRHHQRIPRRLGLDEQRGQLGAMRVEQLPQHGLDVRDTDRRRTQADRFRRLAWRYADAAGGNEAATILEGRRARVENIRSIEIKRVRGGAVAHSGDRAKSEPRSARYRSFGNY